MFEYYYLLLHLIQISHCSFAIIFHKFCHYLVAFDHIIFCFLHKVIGGCPRGVMVKAMVRGIIVREFVLQSRYYVHFQANTLRTGMNPLILPAMG